MISHYHKAIFIHAPKVAGQSIETLFLDDLNLKWSEREPLLLRPNPNPKLGPPRLAHLSITEYVSCGHIDKHKFDSYFKFAFVRNPWDRAVSMYKYLHRGNQSFNEFARQELLSPNSKLAYFYKPQTHFIIDPYGKTKIDYLGRFEDLHHHVNAISKRLNIKQKLRHINRSKTGTLDRKPNPFHYRDFYDDETREIIGELYRSDAEAFSYDF